MRLALLCFALVGCISDVTPDAEVDAGGAALEDAGVDAGPRDPGFDIPPQEWIDGGQGDSWGCMNRNRDRLIIRFETRNASQPWCAALLFKRPDAGVGLFPDFTVSDGFEMTDVRWALTCGGLELPTGELNHARTRPVHDLYGSVELSGFVQERPYNYLVDAGIRVAYRTYWMSQLGSLQETCNGP